MALNLQHRALQLLLLVVFFQVSTTNIQSPCGDDWKNATQFSVLPGGGWDNIRNMEMQSIFEPNFTTCFETFSGKYILPANVRVVPKKRSHMDIFSEIFEHYHEYRSLTASSVNLEAHGSFLFFKIGGSFSYEHEHVKKTQLKTKSVMVRTQLRHELYTAFLDTSMPFSEQFRNNLLDIGYQIKMNNSRVADYLADLLIATYGTHYVTRIDAGGVIYKEDFILSNGKALNESDARTIRIGASFDFCNLFGFRASWSNTASKATIDTYNSRRVASHVGSIGGVALQPNLTLDAWSASVPTNLVPTDRAGLPIYHIITPSKLGEMPGNLVGQINEKVKNAIERYYKANVVKGCMNQFSSNFNPLANIPSKDCNSKRFEFAFGGVYQTCSGMYCNNRNRITNIITGAFSCPKGYRAIHLHSRTFRCSRFCTGWWSSRCKTVCSTYSIFWCSAEHKRVKPDTGYLFGGLFTTRATNPMTGHKNCPSSFLTFTLGAGDLSLCLSRDFELGPANAFTFGGFFSCESGNPYPILQNETSGDLKSNPTNMKAAILNQKPHTWPKSCPEGYSQHLALVDGSCEVMYCTKASELSQLTERIVQIPPFVQLPDGSVPPLRPDGHTKLDTDNGKWMYDSKKSTWKFQDQSNPLVAAVAFLGSVVATMCVGIVIAAIIFVRRRRRRGRELESQTNPELHLLIDEPIADNNPDAQVEA